MARCYEGFVGECRRLENVSSSGECGKSSMNRGKIFFPTLLLFFPFLPFGSIAAVTELWAFPFCFRVHVFENGVCFNLPLDRFGDLSQFRGLESRFDVPRWLARQPNATRGTVFSVENAGPRRRLCSSSVRVLWAAKVWSSLCSFVLWDPDNPTGIVWGPLAACGQPTTKSSQECRAAAWTFMVSGTLVINK